ncbi:hypothetical protein GIB67_037374 [Kingdonia uniflora]|uniref:Uncharacterized protein n=1 Tax=Kingdonia uniflora TaxID=39325 RepID=A0A7J7M8G8_9MAGN|nr:hypothetical protein GIB67_037374 [Kingdonia uniflora]
MTFGFFRLHIIGTELNERITTMAIAANLITYLVGTMHLPSTTATKIATNYAGISFLLCLFGGVITDTFLGKFRAITIFSMIQLLGTILLSLATKIPRFRLMECNTDTVPTYKCPQATEFHMGIFFTSLYIKSIGMAGVKSAVIGFGLDQFDIKNKDEKAQLGVFYNKFLIAISIGTILAVTVVVYIQDNNGWNWMFRLCSITGFLAILAFLSGSRKYRYKENSGSPILQILQVIVASLRKRKLEPVLDPDLLYENADSDLTSRINHSNQFQCLDKAAMKTNGDFESNRLTPNPWRLCSVTRVEEVKMVIRLLPIWAATILFWTIHTQMVTFSVLQAATMDRSLGKFTVPAGSLIVFLVVAMQLTCIIYDRLIIPIRKKWGKQGFTNLQKMAIGLFFSIITMIVASTLEMYRLSVYREHFTPGSTDTVPLTVFFLTPHLILMGIGEAFMLTGQLDFFITQSPKGMKASSTALFLSTLAFGCFGNSLLITIVQKATAGKDGHEGWLAETINQGRLDYFYGLLAILCFINFGLYLLCSYWFKVHTSEISPQQQESVVQEASLEETNL